MIPDVSLSSADCVCLTLATAEKILILSIGFNSLSHYCVEKVDVQQVVKTVLMIVWIRKSRKNYGTEYEKSAAGDAGRIGTNGRCQDTNDGRSGD